MNVETLIPSELPELEAFYSSLAVHMPAGNLEQFAAPRSLESGFRIVTLVVREAGRIIGTIGYIDVPARIADREEIGRWPISNYVLPEYQGRGLGRQLMQAVREGARWILVIGGTDVSVPMRQKSGWKLMGSLLCYRWAAPCLTPARVLDRIRRGERLEPPAFVRLRTGRRLVDARRVGGFSGWLPWVEAAPRGENGVLRDGSYLQFAFSGPLRRHYTLHAVDVNGALAGFFVLAPRAERLPLMTVEIVDLDSAPGRETEVILAARKTGLACADVVRLRICGDRFVRVLRDLSRGREGAPDLQFRISCAPDVEPKAGRIGDWRLTYGDHDQYRIRPASQVWRGA